MIEIVILVLIYRRIAALAASKNRSSAFGWFGVAGWILGELLGAALAVAAGARGIGGLYLGALPGALLGAVIAYVIVDRLPGRAGLDAAAFD